MPERALFDYGVPVVTMLVLVTVGLDLRRSDFAAIARRPLAVGAGVLGPMLLLPALAVALIATLAPPARFASGMLLVACCPTGALANVYSQLARASTALSITITAASFAAAAVTLPAAAVMLGALWQQPLPVALPARALAANLLLLFVPVGIGMGIRAWWPAASARWHPAARRAGFVLLAILLALVLSSAGAPTRTEFLPGVVLAIAFTVSALLVGLTVAASLGLQRPDRFALSASFATRNIAIATAVAVSFGRLEWVYFGAVYLTCQIPILAAASIAHRRATTRRDAVSAARASGPAARA